MHLPKVNLQVRLLVLFVIISAVPLLISNILWFNSSKNQILRSTSARLSISAADVTHQIEDTLEIKQTILIVHSQTQTIQSLDISKAAVELQNFLFQDQDLSELSLLDSVGKERIRITRDKIYPSNELVDQSSSPAFKIPTFAGGQRYISPIFLDELGEPSIYFAIPLVKLNAPQDLQKLTTSSVGESRNPGEINGVLKATYHLTNLWNILRTFSIGKSGYIFLVDDHGNVIAHPNERLARQQKDLKGVKEVNLFLSDKNTFFEKDRETERGEIHNSVNEFGTNSLMTHNIVRQTLWGVIAQIPLSDTLSETNQATLFAIILSVLFIISVMILSLWISGQIVKPIKELQLGSNYIGAGDLNYRINIQSGDEIEQLGEGFNNMAKRLQDAFQTLAHDKEIISVERNKLTVTLSSIADAIIAVDLNRNIIVFNNAAEKLTGLDKEAAIGKPIEQIIKVYDENMEVSSVNYCPIKTEDSKQIVFSKETLKVKSFIGPQVKKEFYANFVIAQIKEGLTANVGCILTLHDVTKEKQLEDMKLDFVSMAAHELRTPLTTIKGYLDVFIHENSKILNIEQNMFLNRINISTQQLTALVENLLSVSRIESGQLTISSQPIDWVLFTRNAVKDFVDRAKEKKINLIFVEPSYTIPHVKADSLRIGEVFTNLISNAIAYTPGGGSVKIWIETQGDQLVTHIQDTGRGIPADAMPHLFTKFFRISGTLEQGSKGTGLGLYISKAIVELHKGKIWVESTVGKGSTFSFALPLEQKNTITS